MITVRRDGEQSRTLKAVKDLRRIAGDVEKSFEGGLEADDEGSRRVKASL